MRVTQLRLHRSPLRGSPSVALATRRRAAAGARTAGWWAPARRERCTAQTATRARAAARAHRTARRRPAAPAHHAKHQDVGRLWAGCNCKERRALLVLKARLQEQSAEHSLRYVVPPVPW
eukprot:6185945-Pleurochrysis_carterae.AAC.2